MTETLLTLSGIGFPPYSARGCQQTLQLIQQPALRRTVNGRLMAVTNPLFQKYRTTVEGKDKHPPAMDTLAIGHPVTVGCITPAIKQITLSGVKNFFFLEVGTNNMGRFLSLKKIGK